MSTELDTNMRNACQLLMMNSRVDKHGTRLSVMEAAAMIETMANVLCMDIDRLVLTMSDFYKKHESEVAEIMKARRDESGLF